MHDLELRHRALDLIAAGVNDCEVSRRLGVARTTVRHWRWAKERNAPPRALCWRCWRRTRGVELTAADYAELLGLYLGDGHISPMPRSERLRLSLNARYPTIIAEAEALLTRTRVHPVGRVLLRQPHRALLVSQLRVPQLVDGHPRHLRVDLRRGRPAPPPVRRSCPALPPGRRR
jgi:Homeodomain-like domain-containing protein